MKSNILVAIVQWIIIFFALGCSKIAIGQDKGIVHYFDFDVPRMTGIPEGQMESYGCIYTLEREKFDALIKSGKLSSSFEYKDKDIRAKVKFKNGRTYYIDSSGIIRDGGKFFISDKKEIEKLIISGALIKCLH